MGVALRGNLTDFGIAEVFQLIGQQRKTGFLNVTAGAETLRLAFDAGGVVWAQPSFGGGDAVLGDRLVRCGLLTQKSLDELWRASESSARPIAALAIDAGLVGAADVEQIENLITDETIFTVLRCSDGSFDFSAQGVRHDRPPEKLLAAEQILMDGLRRVDEWQTFAALVPSGETIFERTGKTEDGLRQNGRGLELVFGLVDGRLPAQRIIDLSRLGLFDATRALAELHKDGLIAPLSGLARAKSRLGDGQGRRVSEHVHGWLAVAFPLALLCLIVSTILGQESVAEGPRVFPIVRAPVEQARAAFEKRRLRHALEAERMLSGRWPTTLQPAETANTAVDALTPDIADDYYYARRGNGIILLAPER
jgi:hypothetical protein